MNKHDQDDLYLIVDFLEQELQLQQELFCDEDISDVEDMFGKTINVIKSLIKD